MMDWLQLPRHRRQVLGAAAGVAAAGLASRIPPASMAPQAHAQSEAPGNVVFRRNVWFLDPDGPELTALRRGVATMQQLSRDDPDDPRGWIFQSCIHGAPDDFPEHPYWRQCQHRSFFFLPWHRMFLYWFERILRWASGDPTLALPYWDYSLPNHRALPEPFRQPADASNPLYVAERDPIVNSGAPPWSLLDPLFDHRPAFTYTKFAHGDPLDASFGGGIVTGPAHGQMAEMMGQLEATPHGQIHVMIGGRIEQPDGSVQSSWMGDLRLAARDPIFWLHHCNIDRLWTNWLALGDGRANPTDDVVWMETPFTFFDETGYPVEMTARDVLDTRAQLGYLYDDIPSGGGPGAAPTEIAAAAPPAPGAGAEDEAAGDRQVARRSLLGASRPGRVIVLGPVPTTVPIRRDAVAAGGDDASPGTDTAGRIVLSVEGLRATGEPGITFAVYLQSAADAAGVPPAESFVGLLSLFGIQPDDALMPEHGPPSSTQSFDVTALVQAAMADPTLRGRLAATFVPQVLGAAPTSPGPWATARRVALSAG